jgi:type VI secretion system protein ImpL
MSEANARQPRSRGRLAGILTARWFLSAVGAIAFALLIWFLGPFIPFLTGVLARSLCVAIVIVVWLVANLILDIRAARRNAEMIAKVTDTPRERSLSAADSDAAEEMGILRERLEEALAQLRKSPSSANGKRQYLYELPWYILIGPPGSGKTTALINSGLKFPLSNKFGKDPLRGVGGTRNCDWWFSDDAILLDTAGRYTTQDSNEAVDQKAWRGFLALLKQFRPRQPINGVLVAIGLPDLMRMAPADRSMHARAIKDRLAELQREFGLRCPVYVFLTKADMLAGFVEFFDDLDREDRAKVWGSTFPIDNSSDSTGAIAGFDKEFDALAGRLNDRLLERINEERDPDRRSRIFGFPIQFASLKPMLQNFLDEIFAPSRFEDRPLLRGVYFTSATQEGTPIDRLMTAMANTFGLADQRPPPFSGSGRSYFVTRLLREVIFGEASLVGANPRLERRERLIRQTALVAIALLALILVGAWTMSYFGNAALIASEENASEAYLANVKPLNQPVVADDNVASIMSVLDQVRGFPAGYDSAKSGAPLTHRFGLNTSPKLESQAIRAYRRALNGLLLPRVLVGIETQLKNNLDNPDYVSTFLPLYLMLGGQGPLDKELAKSTVLTLWGARAYPGLPADRGRQQLERHVDALLEQNLPIVKLDGALLTRARQLYANIPIASRAYNGIKSSAAAQALREWRVVDHAGAAAGQVFTRMSGKLLSEGIPGFFGYDGFHNVLLPRIPGAITQAANEASWVTGRGTPLNEGAIRALFDQTVDLYTRDFISTWDQLLSDVTIAPFRNNLEAADIISTLSSPASPLKTFMLAVAQETTMTRPAALGGANGSAVANASAAVNSAASGVIGRLAQAAGGGSDARGQAIDAHYQSLHEFVAGAPGQSQLDDLIKRLAEVSVQLSSQAGNPGIPSAGGGGAMAQLGQQTSRLPPPLGAMIAKVAGGSSNIAVGATRKAIQDLYASAVLPFCRQALEMRYPLVNSSTIDVAPGDFQQLFRPGGTLDAFFANNLRMYVDTTTAPWRNQKINNTDFGLSQAALVQFERAQKIRDSFFPAGGAVLATEFTLTPIDLGGDAKEVVFDTDGQMLTYSRGPIVPQKMLWPAPGGAGRARIAFTRTNGQTSAIDTTGPWALFRLLDRAKIGGNVADQLTVAFNVNGLTANFQLRASSVRNPFRARDIEQFQCPAQL